MQATSTEAAAGQHRLQPSAGRTVSALRSLVTPRRPEWRGLARQARTLVVSHRVSLVWLGVVLLLSPPVTRLPGPQMDPSWMTGINVASARGWRFGHDIIYTFGPWGYLDVPIGISLPRLILSSLYALLAATALYFALHAALGRGVPRAFVAPFAAAVTIMSWTWVVSLGDKFVLAAAIALVLTLLRPIEAPADRVQLWLAVGFSVAGAFLLQVKITYGVSMLLLAAVAALTDRWWRPVLRNAVAALGLSVVGYLVFWLLAGQRVGDIPAFLRGSFDVTLGYTEGMQDEMGTWGGYAYGLVAAILVVVTLVLIARRHPRRIAVAGVAVAVLGVLWLDAKHAYTRHYGSYEIYYLVPAGIFLMALGAWLGRRGAAIIAAGLLVFSSFGRLNLDEVRLAWEDTAKTIHDPQKHASVIAQSARDQYKVPDALIELVGDHPVQVDPWESAVPWAYGLNWHPVPNFQQFGAYTPYLDELNAKAIVAAPADQMILRNDTQAMDFRNQVWDPPQYQLAVVCNYTTVATVGSWSVLRHGPDVCGAARDLGSQRLAAGQELAVPTVGPDEILVARFVVDQPGLLRRLAELVLKPWDPVHVSADGHRYRLPRAELTGPLLLAVPAPEQTPATPYAGFTYRRLSFTVSGTVAFEAIPLR